MNTPDTSPEAVEKLARISKGPQAHRLKFWELNKISDTLRALASENAALKDELEDERDEFNRHQEKLATEFEGECWPVLRDVMKELGFQWTGDDRADGVQAGQAHEYIFDAIKELKVESAAMRSVIVEANNSLFGSHNFFLSTSGEGEDKLHLSRAIERIKAQGNKAWNENAALREQAVSVKPLEWEEWGARDGDVVKFYRGDGPVATYKITLYRDNSGHIHCLSDIGKPILGCSSKAIGLDVLKAAAQADYKTRILSALNTRTVAEVRKEAFEEVIHHVIRLTKNCGSLTEVNSTDQYNDAICDALDAIRALAGEDNE